MLTGKEILGLSSFFVVTASSIPYVIQTLKGKIKPHVFTWVVWGLVMSIAAAARAADHAGPGAWAGWAGAIASGLIGILSIFKGERDITKGDMIAFIVALSAIPVWQLTDSPLIAVVIVTAIDVIAYYPTCRKSYHRPYEEGVVTYCSASLLHIISLCANLNYSVTTMLTPVALLGANAFLISLVLIRRRQLAPI